MDLEQKYTLSVQALKDYAQQAGFNEVVLGLSGGIDSALVAVMCVDAFGADRVHAYMLPAPIRPIIRSPMLKNSARILASRPKLSRSSAPTKHSLLHLNQQQAASFLALLPRTRRRVAAWCA